MAFAGGMVSPKLLGLSGQWSQQRSCDADTWTFSSSLLRKKLVLEKNNHTGLTVAHFASSFEVRTEKFSSKLS